jgi:cytochrome c-type biogenesis protein
LEETQHEMTLGLFAVFGAGVLTLFTPCVLPMLPVLLSLLFGAGLSSATTRGGRLRLLGSVALFVLGFSIVFSLLGMAASGIGRTLAAHRDGLVMAGGAVIVLLGLKMVGWLRIAWLDRTLQLPTLTTRSFGVNALLLGVVFALGWTPCVGPVLGSVLTYTATASSNPAVGALHLLSYSLGVGVPLLVLGLLAERLVPALRRVHPHLPRVERAIGVLMIATGFLVVLPQAAAAFSEMRALQSAEARNHRPAALALGTPADRPRLVEFFAPDCPVCERMQPRMEQLMRDCVNRRVEILQLDITRPENRQWARRYQVNAVPSVRLFRRDGTVAGSLHGERTLAELRGAAAGLLEGSCAGEAPRKEFQPATYGGCGVGRADPQAPRTSSEVAVVAEEAGECAEPTL